MKITFGGYTFSTKAAAVAFTRGILHGYKAEQRVNHADSFFLRALLELHPSAVEKIGVGAAYFTVEADRYFGTFHFQIHRTDGSSVDFSFVKCLQTENAMVKTSPKVERRNE
jgi:hypothetical protein